jgi:polyhydroxyalkanoate synthesis regulator phasin
MVIEALQSYAQLASGLTKTTREKAIATAKGLLEQAGLGDVAADAGDRVSKLADELLATSKANRQLLTQFVDAEVQKAVGRLGLAKSEDIEDLRAEIAALRTVNVAAMAAATAEPVSVPPAGTAAAPATKRPAKRAPAAKQPSTDAPSTDAPAADRPTTDAPAAKRPAKKAPAKKATATRATPAKTTPTKATPSKATGTTTAQKATAKKATAKKAPAKKAPQKAAATSSDAS